MIRSKHVLITIILVISILTAFPAVGGLEEANEKDAVSNLNSAEISLVKAYEAVLEAEKTSADVSRLIEDLTLAAANLTAARIQLKQRYYNESSILAENCVETARNVEVEASLEQSAGAERARMAFWTVILGWSVSLITICFATILAWRVFKKRIYRKILGMKTEGP